MTKFETVVAIIMGQLEDHRAGIEDGNIERLQLDMRFKPHGGMPRSSEMALLHSYNGPANTNGASRAAEPATSSRA